MVVEGTLRLSITMTFPGRVPDISAVELWLSHRTGLMRQIEAGLAASLGLPASKLEVRVVDLAVESLKRQLAGLMSDFQLLELELVARFQLLLPDPPGENEPASAVAARLAVALTSGLHIAALRSLLLNGSTKAEFGGQRVLLLTTGVHVASAAPAAAVAPLATAASTTSTVSAVEAVVAAATKPVLPGALASALLAGTVLLPAL